MEMKLKQSPSIDQDPQQKQLELQQRQLAMQQFLDQADLSKVEGQIDNKIENKLDHYSSEDQKTLKKALTREAAKIDGETAKIGGIGVDSKTGKIIAQVGEFDYAIIDPKATLEAAKNAIDPSKLPNQEASKTLDPERERSPALDKPLERDSSKVLAKIDAKIEHKLDAYSPEDQQILKQALAEKMVRFGGENTPISDVSVAADGRFAATNERHTAVIEPRAVLEQAHAEQAALAREQAAQILEKENPELAAQKNFSDDRYRHYMSEIQAQMNVLNAERNGPSFWTDAPLERQKEVNDQVSVLNLMRFALHDAADLSIPDQAKYFAKLDSEPFPKTAEEMRIDIIHDPILEPAQAAVLQETSVKTEPVQTEPVQTEPVDTNGEQKISEPLIVMPQLTPEESEVSPSQLANLNENLAVINKEGDEIHAKNADVRAASEAQELININNALSADQTISDKYIEFEKNISDQLKVDPNDDSATATAKRFIAAQLALTRGTALFVGETITSVADLATETGKYVGQSYLAIADALVGEALSRQYPFVQSAVQDKIQTDAKIDAALSNGATAVYNFVSDAGLHMLDTAFFHTLSESSQTFRDANANLYARETKVVNWATNYFSNTGNAYASANFVDLSKNAKDVIDIASSVTGIGAINKVNNAKKAAEAAHKLSDDLVDLEKLNQSNNINKLDDARDLTKTVDEIPETLNNTHKIDISKLGKDFPLSQAQIDEIISIPKGQRPDPSTYLSKEYIDNHLMQFEEQSSRIITRKSYNEYGIGKPDQWGSEFVSTKKDIDDILKNANGSKEEIAKALGIPIAQIENSSLIRIDFIKANKNLQMPSGNEFGVNNQWIPGGKLPTGKSEAIISTKDFQINMNITDLSTGEIL